MADSILIQIKKSMIDKYNHVNYKRYFDLFRKGQDAFMKNRGVNFEELRQKYGTKTIVRAIQIDYSGQLFLGDEIDIITTISKVGASSYTYSQTISRKEKVIATLTLTAVMIGNDGKKTNIPIEVRQKISV